LFLIFSKVSLIKTVVPIVIFASQFKNAGSHLVAFVKSIFEGELMIPTKNLWLK